VFINSVSDKSVLTKKMNIEITVASLVSTLTMKALTVYDTLDTISILTLLIAWGHFTAFSCREYIQIVDNFICGTYLFVV
jgi:hypothetical protein